MTKFWNQRNLGHIDSKYFCVAMMYNTNYLMYNTMYNDVQYKQYRVVISGTPDLLWHTTLISTSSTKYWQPKVARLDAILIIMSTKDYANWRLQLPCLTFSNKKGQCEL